MKWRSMLVLLLTYVDGEQLWEVGKVPYLGLSTRDRNQSRNGEQKVLS